jgi:UDP-glucose 4-epimerase
MRVLVTGGAGFIGSHVVEQFQGRAQVCVLDNLRTGNRKNLTGLDCELIEGSITDEALVRKAVSGVDYVFHLAAMVSVPESMQQPRECVELNVTGLLNVLRASADAGVRKFVLASSAAIYGDNPTVPKLETMVPEPRSPYAITKLDGEYYCALFAREGWLNTACLRFFNVFGPRQNPRSAYAAAVPIFIEKALAGEPLDIYGDGGQTRDFIAVKDIVSALGFVATNEQAAGVFNCGYGLATTIQTLAEEVIRLADSSSAIVHHPPRAGDVRHSLASVARLTAFGWTPSGNLADGLTETLQYFRAAREIP